MKSSVSYRIKLATLSALGVVSLVSAATLAVALTAPSVRVPGLEAIGAEARANRAAQQDGPVTEALQLNRAALDATPMDSAAWMRIAYLKTRDGSPLDAEGLDAIEKSYSVAPLGPDVTEWRLAFLYGHWSQLTPQIREDVGHETTAGMGWRLDPKTITDPSGRLALVLNQAEQVRYYQRTTAARNAATASGR